MSQLEFMKERIRDCDNIHKLHAALIAALETAVWLGDQGVGEDPLSSAPAGEIAAEIQRILAD